MVFAAEGVQLPAVGVYNAQAVLVIDQDGDIGRVTLAGSRGACGFEDAGSVFPNLAHSSLSEGSRIRPVEIWRRNEIIAA